MPPISPAGTKTAIKTSAMAISAPPTSSIVAWAASRGLRPSESFRSMFSTTTMASSTTMPMASTSAKRVRVLIEKPAAASTAIEPTSATGIARIGISAARQVCRNTTITKTTRPSAISSVFSTSVIEALTYWVGL